MIGPDEIPVGLLRVDAEDAVIEANAAFAAWWGDAPAPGTPLARLVVPTPDFLTTGPEGATLVVHVLRPERAAFLVRGASDIVVVVDATDRYTAGVALQRSNALADRTRTRLELVIDASIAFASATTEDRLAEVLATTTARAYRAEESAVLLIGPDRRLALVAGANPLAPWTDGASLVSLSAAVRDVALVSGVDEGDALSARLGEGMRATGVQSVIAAPLRHEGDWFGLFACFFHHPRQFDQEAAPLADALAGQAAQALVGLRLRAQLEYAAMHDPTTGLPNRRMLEEQANDLSRQHRVAVVFVDLDGFKVVNDQLGHARGDEVLREVGRRLQAAVREGDIVARWGGDEFVVVCDAATDAVAPEIAERIRRELQAPYPMLPDAMGLGASVGVSVGTVYDGVRPIDRLIRAADQAMYRAKSEGGNRVVRDGARLTA